MNLTLINIISLIFLVFGTIGICNGISQAMLLVFAAISMYRITSKFKHSQDKEGLQ